MFFKRYRPITGYFACSVYSHGRYCLLTNEDSLFLYLPFTTNAPFSIQSFRFSDKDGGVWGGGGGREDCMPSGG